MPIPAPSGRASRETTIQTRRLRISKAPHHDLQAAINVAEDDHYGETLLRLRQFKNVHKQATRIGRHKFDWVQEWKELMDQEHRLTSTLEHEVLHLDSTFGSPSGTGKISDVPVASSLMALLRTAAVQRQALKCDIAEGWSRLRVLVQSITAEGQVPAGRDREAVLATIAHNLLQGRHQNQKYRDVLRAEEHCVGNEIQEFRRRLASSVGSAGLEAESDNEVRSVLAVLGELSPEWATARGHLAEALQPPAVLGPTSPWCAGSIGQPRSGHGKANPDHGKDRRGLSRGPIEEIPAVDAGPEEVLLVRTEVVQRVRDLVEKRQTRLEQVEAEWVAAAIVAKGSEAEARASCGGWPEDDHLAFEITWNQQRSRGRGRERALDRLTLQFPTYRRAKIECHLDWMNANASLHSRSNPTSPRILFNAHANLVFLFARSRRDVMEAWRRERTCLLKWARLQFEDARTEAAETAARAVDLAAVEARAAELKEQLESLRPAHNARLEQARNEQAKLDHKLAREQELAADIAAQAQRERRAVVRITTCDSEQGFLSFIARRLVCSIWRGACQVQKYREDLEAAKRRREQEEAQAQKQAEDNRLERMAANATRVAYRARCVRP